MSAKRSPVPAWSMSVHASYERAQSSSASSQNLSTSTECMSCRSVVGRQSGDHGDDTLCLRSSAVICEKGVFVAMLECVVPVLGWRRVSDVEG